MENRTSPRFRIDQLMEIKMGHSPFSRGEEFLPATAINISRGGLACSSPVSVEPMTELFLILAVPVGDEERSIPCEGYVTHSRMEGGRCFFGVSFHHIDEGHRVILDAFLADLEAKSGS